MTRWHLYVDESGSFNRYVDVGMIPEHNVIGGYLIPEQENNHEDHLQTVCQNLQTEVNSYVQHMLATRTPTIQYKSGSRYNIGYDSTHASMNDGTVCGAGHSTDEGKELVREIQQHINICYFDTLAGIPVSDNPVHLGGYAVLFANENNVYFLDNTFTYLSILGKGIVWLMKWLSDNHPGDTMACHISERVIIYANEHGTRLANIDMLPVTWRREEGHISLDALRLGISQAALLVADDNIRTSTVFRNCLETIELLRPDHGHPHPLNIACDYLCNTYYRKTWLNWAVDSHGEPNSEFKNVYKNERCLTIDISTVNEVSLDEITNMKDAQDYVNVFVRLMRDDFPPESSEKLMRFWNRLNDARPIIQRSFVSMFIEEYKGPAKDACADGTSRLLIKRTNLVLDIIGTNDNPQFTNNEARHILRANLHLFNHSFYTHIGDTGNVARTIEAFNDELGMMTTASEILSLQTILNNRVLVDCVDQFDHMKGYTLFKKVMKPYWEKYDVISKILLRDRPENAPALCNYEYGAELGSFIQLLTHLFRSANDTFRETLRNDAVEAIRLGYKQFPSDDSSNLSRYYQNCADLLIELGDYRSSFTFLTYASDPGRKNHPLPSTYESPEDGEDRHIQIAPVECNGFLGRIDYGSFLFSHYVRLAYELFHAANGNRHADEYIWAKTMFQPLRADAVYNELCDGNFGKNTLLKAIICWKYGACWAMRAPRTDLRERNRYWDKAKTLFDTACQVINLDETLAEDAAGCFYLTAIQTAIRAEWYDLARTFDERNCSDLKNSLIESHASLASQAEAMNIVDPFTRNEDEYYRNPGVDFEHLDIDSIKRIYRLIAY